MTTAWICATLLALLVFALGFAVSATRGATRTNFGYTPDPTDRLYKMVRAHGNASEYAPALAVVILMVGARNPSPWMEWTMIAAVLARYLQAAGMITSRSLNEANPLRFVGSLGTYLTGFALVAAAFLRTQVG